MPSEVLNIGKIFREEACARSSRKMKMNNQKYKVGANAVQEMMSYIRAELDSKTGEMIELINQEGRTTILDRDVIEVMGRRR